MDSPERICLVYEKENKCSGLRTKNMYFLMCMDQKLDRRIKNKFEINIGSNKKHILPINK